MHNDDNNGCHCHDMSSFLTGALSFKKRFYEQNPELMSQLVEKGQFPSTLVISCSDSRVDPTLLTGAKPGELFMVRNVANIVPPYEPGGGHHGTSSAIEYAVRDLNVPNIIVLGHGRCGGIKALLSSLNGQKMDREFIGDWVSIAVSACEQLVQDPENPTMKRKVALELLLENPDLVERASVQNSLKNLMSYPWVRAKVEAGELALHGWWFDLEHGDLWTTQPEHPLQLMPVL